MSNESDTKIEADAKDARHVTLAILEARAHDATVCPSEVARALTALAVEGAAAGEWRGAMPAVHAAVDQLVIEGKIMLSWKGKHLPLRQGPYRIGLI